MPARPRSAAHHPTVGDIRELLSFRIAVLAAASDRVGQRWLADEFDLRILEWRVLGVVAACESMRFFELASTLFVDKGQLSRLINAMSARGLLRSEPDPLDQRTIRLTPTREGLRLHQRVLARAIERNQRVVSALSQDELATLFALLDKLQPYMVHRAEPAAEFDQGPESAALSPKP